MRRRPLILLPLQAASAAVVAPLVLAQTAPFPSRPVTVLNGFAPGGAEDILARAVAVACQAALNSPFVVDYKAGAGGRIAMQAMTIAAPDGYTLLLGTAGLLSLFPHVFKSLPYDVTRDVAPVIGAVETELAMNVAPGVPANTLEEFVAWAKGKGDVAFASYGAGTPSHFLGAMLNRATGLSMTHVPYKGSAPARQDLLAGQVPVFFDGVGGSTPYLRDGKVKIFATSGVQRSPLLPEVPTFIERGFKDIRARVWFAFVAPARTPKPVIEVLNREIGKAIADPALRVRLATFGMRPLQGAGTPEDLGRLIAEESAHWAGVIKASGFTALD